MTDTTVNSIHVLGHGSGGLYLDKNTWVWSRNIIGIINPGVRYCVWSIHTYLDTNVPEEQLFGDIVSEDGSIQLGYVYFKYDQWVCSYGMKLINVGEEPLRIRLVFRTFDTAVIFYITDYQIVMFDDLASANSFVNSREFALSEGRE